MLPLVCIYVVCPFVSCYEKEENERSFELLRDASMCKCYQKLGLSNIVLPVVTSDLYFGLEFSLQVLDREFQLRLLLLARG